MKQIVVIDPGMMEAGGHHAALLSTFLSYEEICSHQLTFVTHEQLDGNLYQQLVQKDITVVRHFKSNFYENYRSCLSLGDKKIQSYVRRLAFEYIEIFKHLFCKLAYSDSYMFFYPCLDWEHSSALNLAIEYMDLQSIGSKVNQTHKVCCMFTPNNMGYDNLQHLFYKKAFFDLGTKQGVELYASDFETKLYYEKLDIPIQGIHPCYLLPWGQVDNKKNLDERKPKLLLYLGDAKKDKGFNRLPKLITELLQAYNYNVTLVVQYTLAWDYPEIRETIVALELLAAEYSQLQLCKSYWSTSELIAELREVDTIYCTYCIDTYKNKSSGLAWLASFFDIPVVLNGECWLSREFQRLNHVYLFNNKEHNTSRTLNEKLAVPNYFDSLFVDLISWLYDENGHSR
jgi:hypothetical protein